MEAVIPLFKLNFDHQEEEAVLETLRSRWISTGPKCEELELLFAKTMGTKFALSITNCTSSLFLALLALGIKEGDEIICPAMTFAATINSIRYVNAVPVFCDITGIDNLNIDPDKIKPLITHKTKAIVVVHFAGFPCKMDEIMQIANAHNLEVIEDACHGPLSEYNGQKLGSIGAVGCFSFFSNKNISTGEGGMLITDDEGVYNKARLLRSHGMTTLSYQRASGHATDYDILELGYNFRMDDIRASIGIVQLKKLPADLEMRNTVRREYVERLGKIKSLVVPFSGNSSFVSNYIMPVVLLNSNKEKRESIREKMRLAGVQTSVHYRSIHRFSIYEDYSVPLPLTEYVSDNEITLPMYGSLTIDEISYICSQLESIIKNELE